MTRAEAIQSLVRFEKPLPVLRTALATYPWDWQGEPLAYLNREAVLSILRRYNAGELTSGDVEEWAELVEVREDIEADAQASQAVFALANPATHGSLSHVIQALSLTP